MGKGYIGNLFKEGELEKTVVRKESLLTASDGKSYKTMVYNLDVIIFANAFKTKQRCKSNHHNPLKY